MRYDFLIEGSSQSVSLVPNPGGGWTASVGERSWVVEHWSPGQMLLQDGTSMRYGYSWEAGSRQGQVVLDGLPIAVEQESPRSQAGRTGKAAGGAVKAPMNGQVVKLIKTVGESVTAGEVVMVLEAMKMENEVTSPVAGVLEIVHVGSGQAVAAGEPLFQVAV